MRTSAECARTLAPASRSASRSAIWRTRRATRASGDLCSATSADGLAADVPAARGKVVELRRRAETRARGGEGALEVGGVVEPAGAVRGEERLPGGEAARLKLVTGLAHVDHAGERDQARVEIEIVLDERRRA